MENPSSSIQVATAGEALIDMVQGADGRFAPLAGGAVYNLTRALALQGVPTAYLNPLSGDRMGRLLARGLAEAGATLVQHERHALPTSLAMVALDAQGKADYAFYREGVADRAVTAKELIRHTLSMPDIRAVATGCLALAPDDQAHYLPWLQACRAAGLCVVVDANLRPSVVADAAAYRANVRQALALADVIKVSDDDLAWLDASPTDALISAKNLLDSTPAQWVALTRGAQGASMLQRGGAIWHARETAALNIVDTVGAGDCFLAGLLHALLAELPGRSGDRGEWSPLTDPAAARVLAHAVASASHCVERAGCSPPTASELARRIAAATLKIERG